MSTKSACYRNDFKVGKLQILLRISDTVVLFSQRADEAADSAELLSEDQRKWRPLADSAGADVAKLLSAVVVWLQLVSLTPSGLRGQHGPPVRDSELVRSATNASCILSLIICCSDVKHGPRLLNMRSNLKF
jgi:hypothetical protein